MVLKDEKKDFENFKRRFDNATKNLEESKKQSQKILKNFEFVTEGIDRAIWDGEYVKKSLAKIEEHPEILKNDLFRQQFKYLDEQTSRIEENSQNFVDRIQNSYGDSAYLSGAVSQSDINMATGATGIYSFYTEFRRVNPSILLTLESPDRNPYRKKDNLIEKLCNIKSVLQEKVNAISIGMANIITLKQLNDTAHQIREFISYFLQVCDPNCEVKTMNWVEYSSPGTPTQKSRGIFAILGHTTSQSITPPIEDIAKKYRDLYRKLSGLAHKREGLVTPKEMMDIKTYYELFLDYTEIILNLRELHFQV
ncbi:hypothetical protein LCGC14_0672710 [marine sediment metagenome]|uniref:Predicted pPIWI-associating nuclease domain-containing protein n=1 Tax=marine sediment metagenome TaxID=412755 RepID=A0A0F9RAT3_9ZZZZ